MTENRFRVEHRPEESRYVLLDTEGAEAKEIGEESYVELTAADGGKQRVFYHTGVSPDYGGQGLAAVLVKTAVDDVVAAGMKVVPVCTYVVKWVEKNADDYAQHSLAAEQSHLQAVRAHKGV